MGVTSTILQIEKGSLPANGREKKLFMCMYCGRELSTKGNLSRHIQAAHLAARTFPCPECGKKFKRKEDVMTHMRIHTGERPYTCGYHKCGRSFARVSDLRSHERTHRTDAKVFKCTIHHCGKTFTRPYDLKKHVMQQHGAGALNAMFTSSTVVGRTNRNREGEHHETHDRDQDLNSVGTDSNEEPTLHGEQQTFGRAYDAPAHAPHTSYSGCEFTTKSRLGTSPTTAHPTSNSRDRTLATNTSRTPLRKRVRCDIHQNLVYDVTVNSNVTGMASAAKQNDVGCHATTDGNNGDTMNANASKARAHIHGASCGHVAVLHDDHVDFLVEGGQLECYGDKKSRERWVSRANEREDDASCSCIDSPQHEKESYPHDLISAVHWDGARLDQPRGLCEGESHGPQCGHDVVHHAGHLDYVVNGRLFHPVQNGGDGAEAGTFEDHGSIRALDNDFVTFYEMLDGLSEDADIAVATYCDVCDQQGE